MGYISIIIKKIFPDLAYQNHRLIIYIKIIFHYLAGVILYFGFRFKCPCCGGCFRKFLPAGSKLRLNAVCPACGSFERHRLLWLYLKNKREIFKDNFKLFDIAPVAFWQLKIKYFSKIDYVSADISSPLAMLKIDITNIPLRDRQFDGVICCHILEHVPDDNQAMKEILRVLKPDGWAIIQSPVDINREKTYEDLKIVVPEARERIFGQEDHLRIYGKDYKSRLEQAGFKVTVDDYIKELDDNLIKQYSLMREEKIYFCLKSR